jgi:hypothetical protein
MFGIDQQVQQTADAYRGKPQMLQQKYAQNQQLIDLLALQKLKSDKEEASRQMALSMQGKPQTIADQRESQVLDMTKKEVIDEQAGIMQNKMKQMQDAQKKVLQAAGAPQMPAQATPQPQEPPAAGLAGLPAPNIQGMAGGGIVAFRTGDAVEGDAGEAEARQYMERQRQAVPPQTQQQVAPQNNLQAGLARLLATNPDAIYEQRRTDAARDTNFTPEERAAKERQIQERSAADREAAFINGLLGMSGRTTNAGAIAAGGAAAQNTRNQSLAARQRAEGELIDIGPASRMAGLKAGESAYGHAVPALYHGIDAAARMAATGEAAAGRADAVTARAEAAAINDERQRIAAAEARFQNARKEIYGQMDKAGVTPGSPESAPFTEQINSLGQSIYGRLQVPQYFVPDPVMKPPVVTPKPPSFLQRITGSGASRVDTSNPLLRGK